MSEVRQRHAGDGDTENEKDSVLQPEIESEESDGDVPGIHPAEHQETAPTGTDVTPDMLDGVTKHMSKRWKNWTVRFVFGLGMILIFIWLLYIGPIALVLLVMGIQLKCFSEIINIGYIVYRSQNLPWFRTLSWHFLLTANYFIFGESMLDQFGMLLQRTDFLRPMGTYHRFISLSLYLTGVILFVMSLKKKYYVRQFTLFGYTHVTLLIVAVGANLIIRNIFEGIFWFFLSTSCIICNDIWAYFFGFFFGKTPLIKLSPKKTWEGYMGGGLATLVYAALISNVMVRYDYLVCPLEYNLRNQEVMTEGCVRNPVFLLTDYQVPQTLQTFSGMIGYPLQTISMYPITFHAVFLAAFASLIGPFGGFFASGFKRAFKIKDFGDIFPGHGGFMDRFDCQILMGTFTYTYVSSFVRIPNPQRLLGVIFAMSSDEQLTVFRNLCESLESKGLVNCTGALDTS